MSKIIEKIVPLVLCMGFLLGIRDGRVALWKEDDPHPIHMFDIPAASLPPADQLLLRRGVHLADREELWVFLENYL